MGKPVVIRLIGWLAVVCWILLAVAWGMRARYVGDPGYALLVLLLASGGFVMGGLWGICSAFIAAFRRQARASAQPAGGQVPGGGVAPRPVLSPLALSTTRPGAPGPRGPAGACTVCAQVPAVAYCPHHGLTLCARCLGNYTCPGADCVMVGVPGARQVAAVG